jgi:hypothetical protein
VSCVSRPVVIISSMYVALLAEVGLRYSSLDHAPERCILRPVNFIAVYTYCTAKEAGARGREAETKGPAQVRTTIICRIWCMANRLVRFAGREEDWGSTPRVRTLVETRLFILDNFFDISAHTPKLNLSIASANNGLGLDICASSIPLP